MEAGVQELNAGHFLILATFLKEEAALIEEGVKNEGLLLQNRGVLRDVHK